MLQLQLQAQWKDGTPPDMGAPVAHKGAVRPKQVEGHNRALPRHTRWEGRRLGLLLLWLLLLRLWLLLLWRLLLRLWLLLLWRLLQRLGPLLLRLLLLRWPLLLRQWLLLLRRLLQRLGLLLLLPGLLLLRRPLRCVPLPLLRLRLLQRCMRAVECARRCTVPVAQGRQLRCQAGGHRCCVRCTAGQAAGRPDVGTWCGRWECGVPGAAQALHRHPS